MKANEAPEKLYLSDIQKYFDDTDKTISTIKYADDDIEYTRTDAFIEKAARWMEKNLSKYSELTDEDEYGNKLKETVMNVFYGLAVKDFINYMRGE